MIFGNLKDLDTHLKAVSPKLREALDYLQACDPSALKQGRNEIRGDELYIMLQEGETKPLSEGKAEVHMAYTDIHFILEGEERIGYAPDSEGLEVVQDLRDNDALLFEKVPGETPIDLYKGDFLVLVPGEVHRTWGYTRASAPLRKLVVKLKL